MRNTFIPKALGDTRCVNRPLQNIKKLLYKKRTCLIPLLLLAFSFTPTLAADKSRFEYFESQLGYFKQLTLGHYARNNIKRIMKWDNDINIIVNGNMPKSLSNELDSLIVEINHIIKGIRLKRVTSDELANYFIFLDSAEKYLNFDPNIPFELVEKGGVFYIYPNSNYEIINGSMYIDTVRFQDNVIRKHILRKLLTQSLGIPYESPKYVDSIFAEHPFAQIVIKYSNLDKSIINRLYNECVKAGMDKFELDHVLINGC